MAEPLNINLTRSSRTIYPWKEWMDGRTWRLKRGEDFHISCRAFQNLCHPAARSAGKRVITSVKDEDTILIQFVDRDPA